MNVKTYIYILYKLTAPSNVLSTQKYTNLNTMPDWVMKLKKIKKYEATLFPSGLAVADSPDQG